MEYRNYDIVVIGKGNAALCAAIAARDQGASVAMLEAAPEAESGGNSRFAGGVIRFAYTSVDDLQQIVDLIEEEISTSDFGTNSKDEYLDTLFELSNYRTDAEFAETLVTRSLETMVLLRSKGVRFVPNYGRQSGLVNGKRVFFGRMPMEVSGGGAGLVRSLDVAAAKSGIDVFYQTRAVSLIYEESGIEGVVAQQSSSTGRGGFRRRGESARALISRPPRVRCSERRRRR